MVQNLTTPEEIEKWRAERRKRYPTVENMKIRAESQEVRMQRGEKLVDKKSRFGDKKERNQQRNDKQKNRPQKNKNRKQNQNNQQQAQQVPIKIPVEPEVESSDDEPMRKIPKFTGTMKLADYHSIEATIKETSALSVLGMYGGSDLDSSACESHDEDTSKQMIPQKVEESVESQFEIEGEAPEEIPINRATDLPVLPPKSEKLDDRESNRNRKRNRNQQIASTSKETPKPSLLKYSKIKRAAPNEFLEKLLQDDIRHERNILLQCVSFVVKNNFFDPKTSEEISKSEDAV